MKTKTITFNEYSKYKDLNNKGLDATFNLAWKNSKEGIEHKAKVNRNIKVFSLCGLAIAGSTLMLNAGIVAHADVLELQQLKEKEPFLIEKLKTAADFYNGCSELLGPELTKSILVNEAKEYFDIWELLDIIKSAKGLNFEELIKVIPTL